MPGGGARPGAAPSVVEFRSLRLPQAPAASAPVAPALLTGPGLAGAGGSEAALFRMLGQLFQPVPMIPSVPGPTAPPLPPPAPLPVPPASVNRSIPLPGNRGTTTEPVARTLPVPPMEHTPPVLAPTPVPPAPVPQLAPTPIPPAPVPQLAPRPLPPPAPRPLPSMAEVMRWLTENPGDVHRAAQAFDVPHMSGLDLLARLGLEAPGRPAPPPVADIPQPNVPLARVPSITTPRMAFTPQVHVQPQRVMASMLPGVGVFGAPGVRVPLDRHSEAMEFLANNPGDAHRLLSALGLE